MDASLVALAKIIESLDPSLLPAEGDTPEQLSAKHRSAQHLIYLMQALGEVDLGYRFGWSRGRTTTELKRAFDEVCAKELREVLGRCEAVKKKLLARLAVGREPLEIGAMESERLGSIARNIDECLWRLESSVEALERHSRATEAEAVNPRTSR